MDNARQQIAESIKKSSNILVAVSSNPSVDELSAALGLTIILDKLDKRATAIFSGTVPQAIDFLEPGKTFENSADSLRDFIVALNKDKADHLRYKVEGDVVKIYITPYKTTLTKDDLEFSLGDYNIDLVIALGVKDQDHLDGALAAHGKILHDATVLTITSGEEASSLGSTDWHDANASSLSEMIVGLTDNLRGETPIFDQQIATSLLTGIVSATDRFSNERTTSRSMTMAAQLMAAGANQQLIASKLEEAHDIGPTAEQPAKEEDSTSAKPDDKGNELSIEREKTPESSTESSDGKQTLEQLEQSTEKKAQEELEKQLAGITSEPVQAGTLADIENELKQAADESKPDELIQPEATEEKPTTDNPDLLKPEDLTPAPAVADVSAAIESSSPAVLPEVSQETATAPVVPPLGLDKPADQTPAVVDTPLVNPEPVSSPVQPVPEPAVEPTASEPAQQPAEMAMPEISRFAMPPLDAVPAADEPVKDDNNFPMPSAASTPEAAAVLSVESELAPEPAAPTAPEATPAMSVPELPPLPPLPADADLPPLPPPPPPPPVLGQAPPTAPSGAVSGDIFGDGASSEPTLPAAPSPSEPGQFKIPGQG